MTVSALGAELSPATYVPHYLHRQEREWTETNCYVDLWIEVLHALGFEPVAAGACTLASDFEGDQWTMFKYPAADLWRLYGIEVQEMNVWRPLVEHLVEQISFGRLVSVDVDSWYLPDTEGVAYRRVHQKTTVAPQMIDLDRQRMGYFHNAGYFELAGEDFIGLLGLAGHTGLPPYAEVIKLARRHERGEPELAAVKATVADHLARRPEDSPIERFLERVEVDLPWLVSQDIEVFHRYAFGTCRQCGANAELAAEFVDWLGARDGGGLDDVAKAFRSISEGAKWLQFTLARAQRGRAVHLHERFEEMAAAWEFAIEHLVARYGG